MKYYALKDKLAFHFICRAKTLEFFNRKVEDSYWAWKVFQPKGSNPTMDDFLSKYDKVEIEITPLEEGK